VAGLTTAEGPMPVVHGRPELWSGKEQEVGKIERTEPKAKEGRRGQNSGRKYPKEF